MSPMVFDRLIIDQVQTYDEWKQDKIKRKDNRLFASLDSNLNSMEDDTSPYRPMRVITSTTAASPNTENLNDKVERKNNLSHTNNEQRYSSSSSTKDSSNTKSADVSKKPSPLKKRHTKNPRHQSHLRSRSRSVHYRQPKQTFQSKNESFSDKTRNNTIRNRHNNTIHRTRITNKSNMNYNNKRQTIKRMFREAKNMERIGRWRRASQLLSEILVIEPKDAHSHLALARLQSRREQNSRLHSIQKKDSKSNGEKDKYEIDATTKTVIPAAITTEKSTGTSSTSKTANKVQLNPNPNTAREAFLQGTTFCPKSIHLWQAWAIYEQELGNITKATSLFQKALELDPSNPYVCHAFGLMEQKNGNARKAQLLWEQSLRHHSTAALVCSLGQLYAMNNQIRKAQLLYSENIVRLKSARERTEVYLAAAWLEERHFKNLGQALALIQRALELSPKCGRAHVALVRLEGRLHQYERQQQSQKQTSNIDGNAMKEFNSTTNISNDIKARSSGLNQSKSKKDASPRGIGENNDMMRKRLAELCANSVLEDGRLFNAWASLEVKDGNLNKARTILKEAMRQFPQDQSLVQAAGKVEERSGNYTAARGLYSASLLIEPSAPTLVAIAMLELRQPSSSTSQTKNTTIPTSKATNTGLHSQHTDANITMVRRLFDEALLLDPRHGPVYNAYGNMELRLGNIESARAIFEQGVQKNCTDLASVYHGYAKFELSQGNLNQACVILERGLELLEKQEGILLENARRPRSVFLAHTLGMLELNSHRVAKAKDVFAKGIQWHGDSSQLLLGAALCEVRLGNEDGARRLFERAVNADEKHAHAWQSWGVMEMRAGNFVVAKMLFECGIKSNPRHGALWQAYATMESRMGNFDTARTLYAAGIRKCHKHVPLYQAWACLELRGGNYDQAKRLISEALTRNKREGSGWIVAAKIEEKIGNEGLSLMLLRRGLQYAPNHPELYCALANQEVKRGKINEARSLLEKGLEIDPLHAPLYHSLAELEARVFNVEGLANLNKRAATVFNSNALVPPSAAYSSSSQSWSKKMGGQPHTNQNMNNKSKVQLPEVVTTLMEKVGLDLEESDKVSSSFMDVDPTTMLENMVILEDGVIGEMLTTTYEEEQQASWKSEKKQDKE